MEKAYPVLDQALYDECFCQHDLEDRGDAPSFGAEGDEILRRAVAPSVTV